MLTDDNDGFSREILVNGRRLRCKIVSGVGLKACFSAFGEETCGSALDETPLNTYQHPI